MSIHKQARTIKVCLAMLISLVVLGLLMNSLSIVTFTRPPCHEVGCGQYLLGTSVTGQLSIFAFAAKFIYVLVTQINNTLTTRSSCIILELALRTPPTCTNWLHACVSAERASSVLMGAKFCKALSKRISYKMLPIVIVVCVLSVLHDSFHRQVSSTLSYILK